MLRKPYRKLTLMFKTLFSTAHMALISSLLITCCPLLASEPVPWAENAIPERLDNSELQGRLDNHVLQRLVDHGEMLFDARFTTLDGAGRPLATQAIIPSKRKRPPRHEFSRTAGLDANACSSCHNVPFTGGAGDFSANVFVSEGFVHSDFDSTDPQFSNERNTNHLFGAGLVELLAREMSRDLLKQRTQALRQARSTALDVRKNLTSKDVAFGYLIAMADGTVDTRGVRGVDQDLVIRPFSHKGVMTSLRQFTVNALNHHHGMQADERFGPRWTGEQDHDGDQHTLEISDTDVSALVAWQATLPPPIQQVPHDDRWQAAAALGKSTFSQIGCDSCHRSYLPLESLDFHDPGPLDAAGTLRQNEGYDSIYDLALRDWTAKLQRDANGHYKIPLFGDLKRHTIADQQVAALGNELLSQRFVERNVFMTSELWGVASTAPYGHRGDMTTLTEVINAHGGQARSSRDAWQTLSAAQQSSVIAFLKTLIITQ
ncbi:MAG: di-heme oxidoredictase family protein [Granulosicoccus sp.]